MKNGKNTVQLTWHSKSPEQSNVNIGSNSFAIKELIFPNLYSSSKSLIKTPEQFPKLLLPNQLYYGDNLKVMQNLLENGFREKFAAIYIDPPFFSEEHYYSTTILPQDEIDSPRVFKQQLAYKDTWNNNLDEYLTMIYRRIKYIHSLLRPDGAFFLHCDQNASHYLKVLCDEIFDRKNFRNEIIVKRIIKNIRESDRVPRLNNGHDSILFYAKSDSLKILPPPLGKKTANWHAFDAPNIRKNLEYPILGVYPPPGRHWMWSEDITTQALKEGRIRKSRTNCIQYLIDDRITFRNNIWEDVTAYSFDHEYPTEKKESMLEILLQMLPQTEGYIGDFFCGSGTTLVVAERMNRAWIGCDESEIAISTTKKRLLMENICKPFQIYSNGSEPIDKYELQTNVYQIGCSKSLINNVIHLKFQLAIQSLYPKLSVNISDKDRIELLEFTIGNGMSPWISQFQFLSGFGKKRQNIPEFLEISITLPNGSDLSTNSHYLDGFLRVQTILGHKILIPIQLVYNFSHAN